MSTSQGNPFDPSNRLLRQFAGLWIVFFLAIAARQEFQHQRHVAAIVIAALAVTVGPLGLLFPRAIRPIFIGWMGLAYPIGWVVSRVVLGAIFYGLFTPVAWIFRMIGRDVLVLKARPAAATYWCPKPGAEDQSQYLRQF
jgi:RsiW-degrading membrane proteinase PrsW (M82 family)